MNYERNDANLVRGKFRVRGDTIEVHPAYEEHAVRIELFGDEIERITTVDTLTGEQLGEPDELVIFPATHYVAGEERMKAGPSPASKRSFRSGWPGSRPTTSCSRLSGCACGRRTTWRCWPRSACARVSRTTAATSTAGRPGEPPYTLLDFFPKDYLLVIDESHQTVPQLHGQYEGDRSRKETLIEHGFRLPVGGRQPAAALRRVLRAGQPVPVPVRHPFAPTRSSSRPRWWSRSSGRPVWSTPR